MKDRIYGWQRVSVSSGLLAHFHMLYEQAAAYLKNPAEKLDEEAYRSNLLTLWHMFSELGQMEYLIESGALAQEEYGAFHPKTDSCVFSQCITVEEVQFEEKDFNNILRQYLKNSVKLRKV